ncbi:BrnT family toxin [Dongia deserti]|uniref:BrnT family toxin n=1 Tax=Dongia deserti TaxID=2268030 RepID=UPI000E65487C|nr:BrnT family toxin [Dongia deserti]
MRFTWDPRKDAANRQKHGVSFELASRVFDDPNHISIQDRHEGGEERWQTIGLIGPIAIFMVAHTYEEDDGEEVVRIISARKATKAERRRYDERT